MKGTMQLADTVSVSKQVQKCGCGRQEIVEYIILGAVLLDRGSGREASARSTSLTSSLQQPPSHVALQPAVQ